MRLDVERHKEFGDSMEGINYLACVELGEKSACRSGEFAWDLRDVCRRSMGGVLGLRLI